VQHWASLPKSGCTNSDVLTKTNILGTFMSGKAAMIIDGNWDTAALQKALARRSPRWCRRSRRSRNERRAVRGRRLRGLEGVEAPEGSGVVPALPDEPAGREDHRRRRADPRQSRLHVVQPLSNQMLAFAAKQG